MRIDDTLRGCGAVLTCVLALASCVNGGSGSATTPASVDSVAAIDTIAIEATAGDGESADATVAADAASPLDVTDSGTAAAADTSEDAAAQADSSDVQTADAAAPDATPADAPPAADAALDAAVKCDPTQLSDIFQKKIKPLVSKGQPTTCNQCHLSGIDLGLFVQDTPCNSMACMKAKGLVDFINPPQSQVLAMIAKAKPESKLITSPVQQAEYDAFLQWIVWSAGCQVQTCGAPAGDPCMTGALPPPPAKPMLGACDEATLATSFAAKVFKWKYRCDHCHSPTGKDANKSFGGFKPTLFLHPATGAIGAKYTMYNVLALQDGVDVVNPTQSKLLTKPLAEESGGVWHGGGDKFADTKDASYVDFLAWIKTFAACKGKP